MFFKIIFCTIIVIINSEIIIPDKTNILVDYLKFVYQKYTKFDHGYVGIVISDNKISTIDDSLKYIHGSIINPVYVMNFNDLKNARQQLEKIKTKKLYFGHLKLLIVFLELKINNMTLVLQNLQAVPTYRRRCKMLLIVDEFLNMNILKRIFNFLWSKFFLNVIIAFNLHNFLQVYTYNPFLGKEITLQNFTDEYYKQDIYYNKLKNINKHELTCLILRDDDKTKISPISKDITSKGRIEGLDPEIIKNLVHYMNGTVKFKIISEYLKPGERNPWRYTNEVEIDILQTKRNIIQENHIDMINSDAMVLNEDFAGVTESLYPHEKDDLVFLLRRGVRIPYYKYLFLIFNIITWIVLILILLLVYAFSSLVIRIFKMPWFINYFNIFRPIICASIPKLPIATSERIFIIIWIIYCFIIAVTFQSILTSILMETKYHPDITTLQELDESGMNMRLYRSVKMDMKKALNGTSKYGLIDKMIDMPKKFDYANQTLNVFTLDIFNYPIILPYHRAVMATRDRLCCVKNGKPFLNIIPESPLPNFQTFQVTAGSPYLHALEEGLIKFIESGHLIHWRRKWEHEYVIKKIIIPQQFQNKKKNTEYISISVIHLFSAFLILITGQLISIIVFILEICKILHIFNNK